jgi:hypothetical protein
MIIAAGLKIIKLTMGMDLEIKTIGYHIVEINRILIVTIYSLHGDCILIKSLLPFIQRHARAVVNE